MSPEYTDTVAAIEAIIAENAALLGEDVRLGIRLRPDRVRIQTRINGRWRRGDYRDYSSLEAAHEAALRANRRAKNRAAGIPW